MGNFLDKDGVIRLKEKLLTEVDKRIASGGGGSNGDSPTKEEILEGATRVSDVEVSSEVATVEALQKGLARVEADYFPKSGGYLTGVICVDRPFGHIYKKDATGEMVIRGGTGSSTDGANLYLHGTEYTGGDKWQGAFNLQSRSNSASYSLTGDKNGKLTWVGAEVVTAYEVGDTISTSGCCGGYISSGNKQVAFFIPLSRPSSASTVTCTVGKITVRQNNAYLTNGVSFVDSIYKFELREGGIYVDIRFASSIGGTNNDALGIFYDVTVEFS